MNFNDLSKEKQDSFHLEILANAKSVGGKNYFLQMIEDLKGQKPHALAKKSANGFYGNGKLSWVKPLFKETLSKLFEAMQREEYAGDMLKDLRPKAYKSTLNMMKTLKPVVITFKPKDEKLSGFSVSILDTSVPKQTKVTMMYKAIFFYHIDFAKQALNHEIKDIQPTESIDNINK